MAEAKPQYILLAGLLQLLLTLLQLQDPLLHYMQHAATLTFLQGLAGQRPLREAAAAFGLVWALLLLLLQLFDTQLCQWYVPGCTSLQAAL